MNFLQLYIKGGAIMVLLTVCSFIAAFIFFQKWFQFHRNKIDLKELVTGLINALKRDGMIEAITLCDNTPGPVAKILTAAIQAYNNEDDIKQAVEDAAVNEVPRLESHLPILATIAYIAPLLGLLGTVVGMGNIFTILQNKQGYSVADISEGVITGLVTVGAGLCISIVCHIAYNYLVTQVRYFCYDMEKASSEILYFFSHHKQDSKQ